MSLVEKINLTTGTGWMMGPCVGNTGPVPRLRFPQLCLQDGPLGLRFTDNTTAWPAGLTIAAGWNKTAMYERGRALGKEARGKGVNVILGPSMGPIGRLPAGGRNWEGFGADPVLQGVAAETTIRGIQDEGVIATAKHWIANEQEHFRQSREWGTIEALSSNIDDRTLHEIYAWPFADAVRAGVGAVMCSYNQINNSYACQNSKLMNGILKDELGFQGFIVSDWLAQRSGVASALAGLDMTMPGDGLGWQDGRSLWGPDLTKAVLNGTVPTERVNDMAMRIVASYYQMGQDDRDAWPHDKEPMPNFSSWTKNETGLIRPGAKDGQTAKINHFVNVQGDHYKLVRQIATEGIVLLKNEAGHLPLDKDGHVMTQNPNRKIRIGVFGTAAFDNPKGPNACQDRACNEFAMGSGWGSGAVEFPYLVSPIRGIKEAMKEGSVEFNEANTDTMTSEIDEMASKSDLCLVFVTADAGEGYLAWKKVKGDRNDLHLQNNGDDLIQRVAGKCRNSDGGGPVIVVMHNVGPVIVESWIDHPNVKAVLAAHLPDQESGHALASILFGDVNPSGRLPYTIARQASDYGPTSSVLYFSKTLLPQQDFTERMYIDYRYLDANDILPRFDFGFGMSYTTFALANFEVHALLPERTALPAERPQPPHIPRLNRHIPPAADNLWPYNGPPIDEHYIYPYIYDIKDSVPSSTIYPYPSGYTVPKEPSQAGGDQGGNPDLFTPAVLIKTLVINTGDRDGAAVVQAYITFPTNVTDSQGNLVDFPPRQLRGFDKVFLEKGQKASVEIELTRRDLSYWDVGVQNWVLPVKGDFKLALGFSSRFGIGDDGIKIIPLGEGVGTWPP